MSSNKQLLSSVLLESVITTHPEHIGGRAKGSPHPEPVFKGKFDHSGKKIKGESDGTV